MTTCTMKSEANTERLLAWCAGRLRGPAAAELERHMETCTECSAVRSAQLSVWSALDAWETQPPSPDFDRRLYARIEAAERAPWYRRWLNVLRPAFAQPALSLSAAAVVIVAGFLIDHPARKAFQPAPASGVRVSATEAEQVEKTLEDLEMLRQFDVSAEPSGDEKEKSSKSM